MASLDRALISYFYRWRLYSPCYWGRCPFVLIINKQLSLSRTHGHSVRWCYIEQQKEEEAFVYKCLEHFFPDRWDGYEVPPEDITVLQYLTWRCLFACYCRTLGPVRVFLVGYILSEDVKAPLNSSLLSIICTSTQSLNPGTGSTIL